MKKRIIYIVAFTALIAISCTKQGNDRADIDAKPATINFLAELDQTKAGYLDDNFSDGDMIGVFGYKKADGNPWANNELPQLMHNTTLTRQTFDGTVVNYVYNPQKLWPNSPNKVRFFAYYPHSSSVKAGAITPSPETYSGFPYVEVALGAADAPIDFVTAQTNLMTEAEGTVVGGVAFAFKHQLSKLFFKVKASELSAGLNNGDTRKMYINQLAITNIYNKAKYTFYDTEPTGGAWADHSTSGVATIISNSIMAEIGEDYQDLINPYDAKGSYILMIPQENDNVEIEVIYTIERLNAIGGCEDRVVTTRLFPASVNWKSGKVYTYYLEFGFLEINEAAIKLSLNVKDWETGGYDVEMGK